MRHQTNSFLINGTEKPFKIKKKQLEQSWVSFKPLTPTIDSENLVNDFFLLKISLFFFCKCC